MQQAFGGVAATASTSQAQWTNHMHAWLPYFAAVNHRLDHMNSSTPHSSTPHRLVHTRGGLQQRMCWSVLHWATSSKLPGMRHKGQPVVHVGAYMQLFTGTYVCASFQQEQPQVSALHCYHQRWSGYCHAPLTVTAAAAAAAAAGGRNQQTKMGLKHC